MSIINSMEKQKFIPNNKYKYNPEKEAKKYCHLSELYTILPQLRKDIKSSLANFDYSKEHIIYLILAIIDICNFRIGNEKYKKSTGTATLRVNDISSCSNNSNSCNNIAFIGKRNVVNECQILNKKVNNLLMHLSEYKDDNDFVFTYNNNNIEYKITAQDVNDLLHQYGNITTKMFRTWKANYYFIKNIKKSDIPQTKNELNKNISNAVAQSAIKLHHTKTICRRSYIDSRIVNMYKEDPIKFLEEISNTSNSNPYLLDGEEDLIHILGTEC